MPESILITGGAGFVGSSLAIAIRQAFPSARVTALDNLHRRGSELNLPRLREAEVGFVHGDIRCPEDLTSVPPPDLLIECSAEPSAQAGYQGSPSYLVQANLTGCFHCLELARRHRADVMFLSTSRVYPYGLLNRLEFREDSTRFELLAEQSLPGASDRGIAEQFPLHGARSLYGMTKLAAELMVQEYGDAFGLRVIINRAGLLTGPWQMARSDQGVLALWMAAHYFRRPLAYIGFGGLGKQVRDFLHIGDFTDLVIDQIRHPDVYAGRVWNVGGGLSHSLSLLETTALCEEITGNRLPIRGDAHTRPADVRAYLTDTTQLASVTPWRPVRDARRTLSDIFEWVRSEETALSSILAS